jgi:nucleoside-diphosphate-sugar epimerase
MDTTSFKKKIESVPDQTLLIHLAWPVATANYLDNVENIKMLQKSINLFNIAIETKDLRIIGAGSVLELGNVNHAYDESLPSPQNCYAESKAKLWSHLTEISKSKSKWIRIGYQVSGVDPQHKLFPALISNKNSEFHLTGINSQIDFIHREDVAEAFLTVIKNFEIFDVQSPVVGCGRTIEIAEIAQKLSVKVKKSSVDSPGKYLLTHPESLKKFNWKPQYDTLEKLLAIISKEYEVNKFQKNLSV